MTEYKCGNCREVLVLSPKAKFCPECGSSSLNLVIKELKEPAQRETIGVYSPRPTILELVGAQEVDGPDLDAAIARGERPLPPSPDSSEEEDRPRRRRK